MFVSVTTQAHRKLRQLKRYVPAAEFARHTSIVMEQFQAGIETLVGVYQNNGEPATNDIVFTNDGLSALFDGTRQHIPYSEIIKVVRDKSKDIESDEVVLELRALEHVTFFVNGKNAEQGTHDKFLIVMFLESAIAAVSPESL